MSLSAEQKLSLHQMLNADNLSNPYPLYHRLRASNPVFWDEEQGGCWSVTSHAEVLTGLRDARFSAQRMSIETSWIPEDLKNSLEPPISALTRQILFLDPPDHTRLRGLVSKAFTPRMIEKLRPRIQQIVDELLDVAEEKGRLEAISEFTYPLPAIVIAEMLGVPTEDRERFTLWTSNFARLLDGGSGLTFEQLIENLQGVNTFMEYFRVLIRQQRQQPQDNLLQAMIDAEDHGDALSENEVLGNCVLLLAAGHGTTTHLIGNGLLALLRHPEQIEFLRSEPQHLPGAVAELLRFDSPVQMTSRIAKEDLVLGGQRIKAGQEVLFSLGAANHDPAQFEQPDSLNLRRLENRQMAFGQGIHFCLGAPLARAEAEIAFASFFKRFSDPRLETNDVEWFPSQVFRGLLELPIKLV
ncbi:MAG TPA: cytochrome P450 [Ktedonobacteraceae bacterium]